MSLSLAGASALAAGALPTAGTVVAGSGSISENGTAMTVNQSTNKMAIDWQSFSIGQGHTVNFVQPSSSAVALNRVLGTDVSVIQGALKANGQVFLINPNGVLFSPTAQVNVGGLVASTLNMKTEDFLSGKYQFEGTSSNAIINQGNIQAAQGGSVALIAAKITNSGSIDAVGGNVLLGAGSQVMLDFGGPVKLQVQKAAVDALIDNGGAIRADGGTVLLSAKAAGDLVSTVINNTGLLQAQTLATGENGQILLLGDMHNGRVEAGGTLDASAPNGGNGGFIETSAAQVNTASGLVVNASAKNGTGGQWLIDPYDYTINATAAGNIVNTLNTGTSVTVSTQTSDTSLGGSATTGNGDITVASAITKSAGGDATLTLRADRNIIVNSDITSTNGKLNVTLSAANKSGATTGGVDVNGNLKSNGGNILIGGAQGTTTNGIGYAMNLDSSRAAVLVEASKSILSQGGNITINGKSLVGSSSGSYSGVTGGVYIKSNATIKSGTGNLFITGESAGGLNTFGIGFEAKVGTLTTIGSATSGGNMLMNAVNSSTGTAADRDKGAIGLINYGTASGNSPTIAFQGPSVASWLVYINGVPQLSGYTRTPQVTCSSGYLNCGYLVVPGSNNSYLYAAYQAVDLSTTPIYVIQTGNGTKVYDGTTTATGLTLTSLGGPSGFAVADLTPYPAFDTSSKNVGTYSDLIANASNPKGFSTGGTNYAIGYYNTGTYTITPKALTPIASDKVYDGTTTAAVTATGVISGDNVTMSGNGAFGSKNVGNYNVSITGISLSGADAGNYSLSNTSASANANITQRTVTLSATKTYDGSASLDNVVTIGNLVNGEDLSYSSATANSANVGSAQYINAITLADGNNGSASNYRLPGMTSASAFNSARITPKALTVIGMSASDKVYDGSVAATLSGGSLSGLVGLETLSISGRSASFDDKNVGTNKSVTVSGITLADGTGLASNYTVSNPTGLTASITPKTLTVSGITASNKTYDGTAAVTVNTANTVMSGLINGDTVNLTATGAFGDKNVGNGKTVNLTSSYGGADAGNYTITDQASTTANITPKSLTVSGITASDKTYDGNTSATLITAHAILSGLINGDTVNVSTSGAFTDKNAGNGKTVNLTSSYSGADANNYTITSQSSATASITPKALTVSGITATDKTYDGTTAATVSTANTVMTGLISGDTVNLTVTGTFGDKNVANGKTINLTSSYSGVDAGNYTITDQASTTANITPKALTVSGIAVSDKTYDGNTSATVSTAHATLSGLINGDTVNVSATGIFGDKNAGNGKTVNLTSSYSGADAGNYTITNQNSTTASITPKALTVSGITASNKTYDGNTSATVSTANAAMNGLISGDTVNVSASGAFTDKNAGNGKTVNLTSSYSGADAGNYTITNQASTTASITPKALTVSGITATDKTYDGTTAATVITANAVMNGLVNGDTVNLTASGAFIGKNAGNGKTVNLTSSYSGSDANNYTITSQNSTTASITPKALTVSGVTATDKTYDGSSAAIVSTANTVMSGLINGDTVNVSATGTFADKNVANGKTVSLTSSYGGADAGNYTITNQTSTTASITPKALMVSGITASNKTYDGNTSATVSTANAAMNGLISGDTVNVSASGAFTDKNAANGKTVNLTNSYSGADAGNYTITSQASTTASITPKALTVSGITASNKTYDGTTAATVNTANAALSGLISGDTVNVSAGGTFADKNAGTNKSVNISGITLAGADAGNYTLSSNSATTTATIAARPITVAADNQTKKSGSADPQLTWNITGGSLVGSDTLAGELVRDAGESTGSYGIHRGTLGNSNYALAFVDGALTISSSAPAVSPAQYTSTVPNLTPPAVGGLTYVAVPEAPSGATARADGSPANTAAPQQSSASPMSSAPTGDAPGSTQADGSATAGDNSTPTVVSRQKQTASQATTAGRDVKFLNVMVVSGGIRMPSDLTGTTGTTSPASTNESR